MKKVSNQAQAVNILFTSNWCYEQTIQLRPMKFYYKKRQAYYYMRTMIPGHEEEASRSKSLILFCVWQCSPCSLLCFHFIIDKARVKLTPVLCEWEESEIGNATCVKLILQFPTSLEMMWASIACYLLELEDFWIIHYRMLNVPYRSYMEPPMEEGERDFWVKLFLSVNKARYRPNM